jgi:hypothetical protein
MSFFGRLFIKDKKDRENKKNELAKANDLPNEILLEIFTFMGLKTKWWLVCRKFYEIYMQPATVKQLCNDCFNIEIQTKTWASFRDSWKILKHSYGIEIYQSMCGKNHGDEYKSANEFLVTYIRSVKNGYGMILVADMLKYSLICALLKTKQLPSIENICSSEGNEKDEDRQIILECITNARLMAADKEFKPTYLAKSFGK